MSEQKSGPQSGHSSGYSLDHITDTATLSTLLLHLSALLPPEDVNDITH